jgi:hypothetical protein
MGRWGVLFAMVALSCFAIIASAASGGAVARTVAAVELRPDGGSAARGAAYFAQRGARLSGWVVVWGLEPGSTHAVHFHGPNGTCASKPAKPAMASHEDLRADSRGVAFRRFAVTSPNQVLRRGFYYNVHEHPTAHGSSPSIACGALRPLRVRG